MTDDLFRQNQYAFRMSREDAIMYGHVEPTEDERIRMRDRLREYLHTSYDEDVTNWTLQQVAAPALDAITDPKDRELLDLHSRADDGRCAGCDAGVHDEGARDWPCTTARLVARWNNIDLPTEWQDEKPEPSRPIPDDWKPSRQRVRDLFPQPSAFTSGIEYPTDRKSHP